MHAPRLMSVLLVLSPFSSPASEQDETGRESPSSEIERTSHIAHSLFRDAEEAFRDGRFDIALESYLAAYELLPRPGLHVRIGACHQALNEHDAAIERLERFLIESPYAPNRREVEASLQESRDAVEFHLIPLAFLVEEGETSSSDDFELPLAPILPIAPDPAPEVETVVERPELVEISPIRDPMIETEQAPPEWVLVQLEPGAKNEKRDGPSFYERWWFWAAVGATAAAAGGAAYAGARPDPVLILPSGSLGSADWR